MFLFRRYGRYLLVFVAALALTACVYDYDPIATGQAGYVTVEGDILIGEECAFSAFLSTGLNDENNRDSSLICSFRVEASDGTVYPQQEGCVDLRAADVALEYRLVADVSAPFTGTYASQWASVQISQPLDSLSWSLSDNNARLWVNVSTHTSEPAGYYRWIASETWEYHATYYAEVFFAMSGTEYRGRVIEQDAIVDFEDGDNTYFCWKSAPRSDILLGSTAELSEDRLVDYGIYSFLPGDRKVSHVYFVELAQIRLTEAAYRYWSVQKANTTNVGGLFSPEPVELRGNVQNLEDPDELVLGYVSVATCARSQLFIDNYITRFSRWRGPSYGIEYPFPGEYRKYYGWQYRPGWYEEGKGYAWLPKECVDCRVSGGTKDRPSWWITDDK